MFGLLPPENYLCGNSINLHISHHDFIYLSPSYEKLKVEEKKTWQIVFPESYVIEHF